MSKENFSRSYISQTYWNEIGTITLEQTVLAGSAGELADAAVEALADTIKVIYRPENGTVAFEVRFYADGGDDIDSVVEMYAGAGVDHYRRVASLTITEGDNLYATGLTFVQTIAQANNDWIVAPAIISTADNHFASYAINTYGYDRFLFIASDLDATTIYVSIRAF